MPAALAYGVWRHRSKHTPLSGIGLCIVDTSKFPHGTFVNDADLMNEFSGALEPSEQIKRLQKAPSWSVSGLPGLPNLRTEKKALVNGKFSGHCYFGEYLSQGELKIEYASTILKFDKIADPRYASILGSKPWSRATGRNGPML